MTRFCASELPMSGRTALSFSAIWLPTGSVGSKAFPGSAPMKPIFERYLALDPQVAQIATAKSTSPP